MYVDVYKSARGNPKPLSRLASLDSALWICCSYRAEFRGPSIRMWTFCLLGCDPTLHGPIEYLNALRGESPQRNPIPRSKEAYGDPRHEGVFRPRPLAFVCGEECAFSDHNFGGRHIRMHQSRAQLGVTCVRHMNMFVNIGDLGAPERSAFSCSWDKPWNSGFNFFSFPLRNTLGLAQCGWFQKVLKTHLV